MDLVKPEKAKFNSQISRNKRELNHNTLKVPDPSIKQELKTALLTIIQMIVRNDSSLTELFRAPRNPLSMEKSDLRYRTISFGVQAEKIRGLTHREFHPGT